MENYNIYIAFTLISLILLIIHWVAQRANYWKYQNVSFIKELPFLGNLKDVILQRKSIYDLIYDIYFDKTIYDQSIAGFQLFHKSAVIILEPELIKQVLIKDFNQFSNRYAKSNRHIDKIGNANLLLLRNPYWRYLRSRLSPIFSSAKLKNMFYLIVAIGNDLNRYLTKKNNENNKSIKLDYQDLSARFTTDVIASCAFGVQSNSIENPKSDFYVKGISIFKFSLLRGIEFMSFFMFPELVPIFRFKFFGIEADNFLRSTVLHVMEEREKNGVIKNDLIDTLIQLKNEDKDKVSTDEEIVLEGDVLVGQAAAFFAAGFSTTSSLILFTLYELAMHEDCQKRLRREIKHNLLKNGGELTYEMVNGMEYLNMIVQETLRLYPTLPFLDRQCELSDGENGYSLEPYHRFKIPNGMPVLIPIFALHRDPKYFPDPLKFNPERFSNENKHSIRPNTYFPFGGGPRGCIGERLGLLEGKIGIITFLKCHYVAPTERTPKVMTFDKKAFVLQPENDLYLNSVSDPLI